MTKKMDNFQNKYKHLLDIIESIESYFPLKYNIKINTLFSKLQKELNKYSKLPPDIIKRLQIIWSQRGYSMEKHFSIKRNYQQFDFYPKYKKLLQFDTKYLKKLIRGKKYHKIIFIGSGPLPLTLKLLRLNIQKEGYDLSKEAINLSKKSIPKDIFGKKIIYKEGNFFTIKFKEKKPVILYIAGLIKNKKKGIKRIAKQLPKGSLMVIRTVANDSRSFLYERIEKNHFYKIGEVKEFIPTYKSGIVNGIIIVKINKNIR